MRNPSLAVLFGTSALWGLDYRLLSLQRLEGPTLPHERMGEFVGMQLFEVGH